MSENITLTSEINSRASSGTIVNNFRSGYRVQISWSVNSQNIANNTSNVTVKAQLVSTGSGYSISSSASKNGSLTINGTKYSFTFTAGLSSNQTKTVFTKTVDIPHNSDGSKTFSMSATLGINVTLSGKYWGNVTASGDGTLNAIPRTSTISLSETSINLGESISININRASSSFTHKVYYDFGSKSATISTNATTSATYTVPKDHGTVIPNGTSGTATITVHTYNGSTKIGSTSKNFTVKVPSSMKPTLSSLSASVVADGADASFGYVKGKSKCKLTINGATGSYGSTIKSYSISGGGFSGSSSSFTTGNLTKQGNITFTATVTDSRGRKSDAKTVTINVADYANPSITKFLVARCTSNGTLDDSGTFIKITPTYVYSSIGGKNSVTTKAEFKLSTDSAWVNAGAINSGSSLVTGSNGILADKSYNVRFTVTDKFTSINKSAIITTAFVTIDLKKGGKGVAIGKIAESEDLFDVNMNASFRKTLRAEGGINANTNVFGAETPYDATRVGINVLNNSAGASTYCPTNNGTLLSINYNAARQFQIYSNNGGNSALYYRTGHESNTGGTATGFSAWARIITDKTKNANITAQNFYLNENEVSSYKAKDTSGTDRVLAYITNSDNSSFGKGLYNAKKGKSIIYGYDAVTQNTVTGDEKSYVVAWEGSSTSSTPTEYFPTFRPKTAGIARLGTSSYKWHSIWSVSTTINSNSDRRLKEDIKPIDKRYEGLFMDLNPVNYRLKQHDDHRVHNGFVAQEVEEAMEKNGISFDEFSALTKSKPEEGSDVSFYTKDGEIDYEYGLGYGEFTALNTHMIQKCLRENQELKQELEEVKEMLNELMKTK